MKTPYNSIADINRMASHKNKTPINNILSLAKTEKIAPADQDETKTLLLAIDIQNDFMEDIGSLAVPGSRGDVERLTQWMYNNMTSLTQVICSLDCHTMMQIFHPQWWINDQGEHPDPFTIIHHEDVKKGLWTVVNGETDRALEYLYNLEIEGKKQLCIWPYHCIEGTIGAQLENEFTNMLYFHAAARKTKPTFIYKGQNPYTEMYGIIKAEYDPEKYINYTVLEAIREYDAVFIAGEASSHCVLASVMQILAHYADEPDITSRITLLTDCMSPIAGFEDSTLQQFDELRKKYGIQLRKSTEVVL